MDRRVLHWERSNRRPDTPLSREDWEADYGAGRWEFLADDDQEAHYGVIAESIRTLRPGGPILDVGCGTGQLWKRLRADGFGSYTGIDISATALARLLPAQDSKTTFLQADAETFVPESSFDVVVFCETLYYFHDPLAVFRNYSTVLRENGIALVSTFVPSKRARAVLQRLKAESALLAETTITRGPLTWVVTTLQPGKPR